MIYVKLNDKSFWYDVYNIIKMFFKNDEIVLIDNDSTVNESLSIETCKNKFCVQITIKTPKESSINKYSNENNSNNVINVIVDDMNYFDELSKKKKNIARRVYMALCEYTGKQMPWGMLTGVRPAKIPYEMMEQGMNEKEIIDKLENYYFISSQKADLAYSVAKIEKEILECNVNDMVSIYIGIPFCKTQCNYCSFTSNSINKNAHLVDKYLDSLKREIQIINEDIFKKEKLRIQTIYIGGGTPTSINNDQLEGLLNFIDNTLNLKDIKEYTLEAGRPDTIDREKLITIKNSRVNRISINPQTMNIETLRAIGRNHTPEELVNAFYLARKIGFDNINMDIIVGLPGEDLSMFKHTMDGIKSMNPESLTVHSLAVKRSSKLKENLDNIGNQKNNEKVNLATDEMANCMSDMSFKYALSMGMHPYYMYRQKNIAGNLENVGYSRPGFESIYNIQIMEEKQTIVAFGAGAVTKVLYPEENRLERAFNVKNIEEYINRVDEMTERKKKLFKARGH